MISAAEAQLVGCPLPAAVVERTESIRKRVALSCSICNATCSKVSTVMTSLLLPSRTVAAQRCDSSSEDAGLFAVWTRLVDSFLVQIVRFNNLQTPRCVCCRHPLPHP